MVKHKPPLIVADTCLLQLPGSFHRQESKCASAEWQASIGPVQEMIDADYEVVYQVDNPHLEGKVIVLARRGGPFADKK